MIKVKLVPLNMGDSSDEFLTNSLFIIGNRFI
jgi:hypothetical protein